MRRPAVTAWLLVVAWCAVIFALSAVPSLGTGLGTWDLLLRKLAHMAEYAILGLLLARALDRSTLVRTTMLALAFVLGVAYAVSDEIHQTFVRGRAGRPVDVLIDAVGVVIGLLVWHRWSQAGNRRSTIPDG
jgi:VanZ family protein